MAFKKGMKKVKGSGVKKGQQHKVTIELKQMILGALDKSGGQAYLQQQAKDNPTAFLTLIGKVLPLTVNGNIDGKVTITWEK